MIVVTGAAGFIGSCLVGRLNGEGYKDIVVVDDFSDDEKNKNLEGKKYSKQIDRMEFHGWLRENHMLTQFVFHLGARTDTTEFDVAIFDKLNLNFTKELWNICVEFGLPLVYASSAATYGLGEFGYEDNHDIVEKPPFIMKGDEQQVIHINFHSAEIKDIYYPQVEVIGDIGNSVIRLGENLDTCYACNTQWVDKIRQRTKVAIHSLDDDDSFPMLPQRVVSDVRKVINDDGIVSLDNGMFKLWFARHYHAHQPNTLLLDNALATMGAGLPSAIACSLMYPDKQVLAVCGDGGFMMNSQELETATRLKLNLVVLIINDNGYGMIKWKQAALELDNFGLDFNNPDFVKYAESYGAIGHRIEQCEQLIPTMEKAFNTGGVHVIDLPIDYSQNTKTLLNDLKQFDY